MVLGFVENGDSAVLCVFSAACAYTPCGASMQSNRRRISVGGALLAAPVREKWLKLCECDRIDVDRLTDVVHVLLSIIIAGSRPPTKMR